MKQNLIVVQTVFDDLEITKQSVESMRLAAHRWCVDFYELSYFKFPLSPKPIFWDRNWIMKNFINYDKVLILDPDVIINNNSASIFDELGDYDMAVVKDGNISSRFSDNLRLKNSIVKHISSLDNCIDIFSKNIPNFNYDKYWENYFNNGVFLFRPKKILSVIEELESLIFTNCTLYDYLKSTPYSMQNLHNAFITSRNDIKIKYLDDKWNWIAPDIAGKNGFLLDQFDPETGQIIEWESQNDSPPTGLDNFYHGKMHPYIYHFCGTNMAKELLKNYENWKL